MALKQKVSQGLTLVELMVVIAIIALLASLITPLLVNAKHKAKITNDINLLRQIGVAAILYSEQHGEYPGGCSTLVDARAIDRGLCGGIADRWLRGSANEILSSLGQVSSHYLALQPPYKYSFFGKRELAYKDEEFKAKQEPATNPGWLVYLYEAKLETKALTPMEGPYYRLLYDGSVVFRVSNLSKDHSRATPGRSTRR